MNTVTRLLGLLVGLVLLLVAGSALGERWAGKQYEKVRNEFLQLRRGQFEQILELAKPGPVPWSPDVETSLARAVGGHLVLDPPQGDPAMRHRIWSFDTAQPGIAAGQRHIVRVEYDTPHSAKLLALYQRVAIVLLLLSLTLLLLLVAVVFLATRENKSSEAGGPPTPFRAEMNSLARLARVSVEQGAELERERNERLRIQEDLNFQQVLLNRALEEKIRLGHDLHDGIIQSLYATGLTLEAAQKSTGTDPKLAGQQLETALKMLNTTIRDVRSYILGLSPENLHRQTFSEAVRSIADTLAAGKQVQFDIRVDESAAAKVDESQHADLLQIVREAISNSLRHGHATEISVRLHESQGEIALAVQDNGRGFDLDRATRGHGLDNMQARAEHLSANVRCSSTPGAGTRIVVTLPVVSAAHS
ncbi:hypothetical protein DB347_19100 [Opitutaceae bacterium EW11]|nr:hypothetical protein DB347_19100 [Opitutaceae bacterium EW11]